MTSMVEAKSGSPAPERVPMGTVIDTDISARLDRLPWGRFHVLVIVALGITWVLDGLEVHAGQARSWAPCGPSP